MGKSDARAIAFAMPLLQKADRVTVLTVIGGTEVSGPSAEQLVRNVRRNWIGAELKKAELDGRSTGETSRNRPIIGLRSSDQGRLHTKLVETDDIRWGDATRLRECHDTCPARKLRRDR